MGTPSVKMRILVVTIFLALSSLVITDVYMQNPRGSNNRLNEKTSNRENANRLFDSQNNNKGGYNTGDRLSSKAGDNPQRIYHMQYYASGPTTNEGTKLMVEWTNQHGCGEDHSKMNCNVVIQYMCQSNGTDEDYPHSNGSDDEKIIKRVFYLRDGVSTDTQKFSDPKKGESDRSYDSRMLKNTKDNSDKTDGLHETVHWYDQCKYREANGGLFTADQDLEKDDIGYVTSTRTRQNNDGDRSGYECPEERDYFPYWQPTLQSERLNRFQTTPWIDVAWLGDTEKCDYIKENSFNRNSKFRCVYGAATLEKRKPRKKKPSSKDDDSDELKRKYGRPISKEGCTAEGGRWVEFLSYLEVLKDVTSYSACAAAQKKDKRNKISWKKLRGDDASEVCVVQAPEVMCGPAPWTRVNHLGNAGGPGQSPNASRVEVDMPHFPSGDAKRCVLRLRYNISTSDYDGWNTYASSNDDDSVIENDPEIDVLGNGEELELALNTAQTGRTFQDRSHVFEVLPRMDSMAGKTLHNLNVRGKRGNIVQTFPATEYDFIPDRLVVNKDTDLVHVQWTGSNTHDNNNDGDAGEGEDGTDRHNLLEMTSLDESYPLKIEDADFWSGVESLTDTEATGEDIAIGLATSGFYCAKKKTDQCPASLEKKRKLDDKLNNAPASYFGHVLKFTKPGTLFYMCSRNNNFSNRSQKGALWVKD